MKKAEALFTAKFRIWAKKHMHTGAFEIKHTRGKDYFNMRELYEHQRMALLAADSKEGFAYKIPDDGRAFKPFDMIVFKESDAWVVIAYPKEFVIIEAHVIIQHTKPTLFFADASKMAFFTHEHSELYQ